MRVIRTVALCCLMICAIARADVRLPSVISDNMVLQPMEGGTQLWGWADPGEQITISLLDQKVTATADENGRWKTRVNLPDRVEEPFEITFRAGNTIVVRNVLVGDVWICSGQSNMQWTVRQSANADAEIASADYPRIRLFNVPHVTAREPAEDVKGRWVECSPRTVGGFSAVGYYFGRELHQTLNRPIGLINSSWGGTPAEAWTRPARIEQDPVLKVLMENQIKRLEDYPRLKAEYDAKMAEWIEAGRPRGQAPREPFGPDHYHAIGNLWHAMIHPFTPLAIRGVIWYQGESNAGQAKLYETLFPAMITDWREQWQQDDFPFLFVQLANFRKKDEQPQDSDWPNLRHAQTKTLSLPNTAMAVTIDVGDANDIHPRDKQTVGHRLALAALGMVYGRDVVYQGPMFRSMKVEGDRIRVEFDHAEGGLVVKGDRVGGFAIAGEDGKFVWAEAEVDGSSVIVHSPQVPNPKHVRYAWSNNPDAPLYNQAGLPAVPFATDKE